MCILACSGGRTYDLVLVWIYLILINSKYHLSLIKLLNDHIVDANGRLCKRVGLMNTHLHNTETDAMR